jgi:FkbM family methyltransferase
MDVLRSIYHRRLRSEYARRTYIKWVSLACRLFSIRSLKGRVAGVPIYVSPHDTWGLKKFYFKRSYDIESIEMLKDILRSKDDFVFWDIGANYGAYSLLLSPYATCTVSVEPSSQTFRHLSRSCKEAEAKVILENCAVADSIGQCMLYLSSHHFGDHRTYRPFQQEHRKTELVKLTTIDDIAGAHFQSPPRNNLMKIDVQGAECAVLRGAKHLISNSSTVFIFLEVWPKGLTEIGTSLDELIDICRTYGLVPVDRSGKPYEWDLITSQFDHAGNTLVLNVLLTRGA